jgi:tetratricopeptide (TPR) repeat protein
VNKAACLKNGIVPPYLADKMVDSVYWTIRSNQLYKNDLMLLDIMASTNWSRSLYFAAPSSVSHCANIDSFCLVQGWVYKFMPVKAGPNDYIQGMGGVDALTSYDIMKNKCSWGNLNDPHTYVDPESLNNSVRPKTNLMRVAQSLLEMGKKTEAIEMLDLYQKYFPDSKIPYDMYMLPFADIYYKAGATEKATKLMNRVAEIYSQNLDYYYSFGPERRSYFEQDVQTSLGIIRRISMMADENKQPELGKKIDALFNAKLKAFQ